jgi:hypothetical protein
MKPRVLLNGEVMMDVEGCEGRAPWGSGNVTVSRKVIMKIVRAVPRGRIMNFNDWQVC